jgi:hypothetical protein
LGCSPCGNFQKGIVALFAALQVEEFSVYSRHEFVEVLSLFLCDGELVVEKVGEEALA